MGSPQIHIFHIISNDQILTYIVYIRCFLEKEIQRHCCSIYCLTYQHVQDNFDKNLPNYLNPQIRIFLIISKFQILTYIVYIRCFLETEKLRHCYNIYCLTYQHVPEKKMTKTGQITSVPRFAYSI